MNRSEYEQTNDQKIEPESTTKSLAARRDDPDHQSPPQGVFCPRTQSC